MSIRVKLLQALQRAKPPPFRSVMVENKISISSIDERSSISKIFFSSSGVQMEALGGANFFLPRPVGETGELVDIASVGVASGLEVRGSKGSRVER